MVIASSSSAVADTLLWIVLYVGPDLMLPLTSAFAAIAGVVLMFWHRVVGLVRTTWQTLFQRHKPARD
jgi:hypothetical protein